MAWQNELTIIVRNLVNDVDSTAYVFSDCRIEECIVVAAQLCKVELIGDLMSDYTIDVDNLLISPDPTTVDPKDESFMVICCLRAAIILMSSTIKTYAMKAFSIRDGLSSLDMRGIVANMRPLLDDLIKKYDDVILDYKRGTNGFGLAILSPYSPGSYGYGTGRPSFDNRDGYYFY